MRTIRILAVVLASACTLAGGVSLAASDVDPIVVIDVSDPMDQRMIDYVLGTIESETAHAFVLKIDSPGVSSGDLSTLYQVVAEASAPVVAWIGPSPAVAYGGAAYLANHADIRSAAPGAVVGYLDPAVQRGAEKPPSVRPGEDPEAFLASVDSLRDATVTVGPDTLVVGFVDRVDPALGQLLIGLDGQVIDRGSTDEVFELSTIEVEVVDGQEVLVQSRPVKFIKPGLLDRFLRLAARPETAFLFLVIGLAFAVFEFYAAGAGLMAFVAGLSLAVSGYGLATLPIWWPAVAMVLAGVGILVWGFIQNRTDWRAVVGTGLMLAGGVWFTSSRPQYPPALWMVVLATAVSVLFIWYTLTTVVRGRFATPTVGREELIGSAGLTVSALDPFGIVTLDGARWQATADRGVEITAGAAVQIVGITGLVLEVDPVVLGSREESS